MTDRADLEIILASHFPLVTVCTHEEQRTVDYDSGTSKRLLGTLLTWMAENTKPVFMAEDIERLRIWARDRTVSAG